MNLSFRTTDEKAPPDHGLLTLCIAGGLVALSAGSLMLPTLYPALEGAARTAPAMPAAGAQHGAQPAVAGSPEEETTEHDRELLAYATCGG